jgi:hypothetical protein
MIMNKVCILFLLIITAGCSDRENPRENEIVGFEKMSGLWEMRNTETDEHRGWYIISDEGDTQTIKHCGGLIGRTAVHEYVRHENTLRPKNDIYSNFTVLTENTIVNSEREYLILTKINEDSEFTFGELTIDISGDARLSNYSAFCVDSVFSVYGGVLLDVNLEYDFVDRIQFLFNGENIIGTHTVESGEILVSVWTENYWYYMSDHGLVDCERIGTNTMCSFDIYDFRETHIVGSIIVANEYLFP